MTATTADPTSTAPVVRVQACSRVEVPSDRASLFLTVTGVGNSPARATAALRRAHARLTRVLTRFDATVTHAQTTHAVVRPLSASPASEAPTDPPALGTGDASAPAATPTWQAEAEVRVDVHDVTGVTALYAALTKTRPMYLTAPVWGLRPDHPAYLMVRRDAVRAATQQARAMAEASGSRLLDLVWLEDVDDPWGTTSGPGPTGVTHPGGHVGLVLEPAPQTVTVTVRAQYRIAPVSFDRTNETRARS